MAFWTNHQVDKLSRWYGVMPVREIADRLDKSIGSIYSKAYHMGLKRPVNYRDAKDIKLLLLCGWSQSEIAKHLGVATQSLHGRLNTPAYSDIDRAMAAKNWRMRKTA